MKRIVYVVLIAAVFSGCRTTKAPDTVLSDFASVIFDDGISMEESIFIAKKEVRDKTPPKSFLIEEPKLVTEFENMPYQDDFWFVSFPQVEKSVVPNVYMVAMRRNNGKVVFSRAYVPENEWVLEAVILKLYEKQKNITP
jgi:hypothetical protein